MNPAYLLPLSLAGFLVSFYINYSKIRNKPLVCHIGQDCDAVVKSKYGKTFGVENTIHGMMYYILVFSYGAISLLNRNIFKGSLVYYFVVGASIASVLFSAYLIIVQAFVLKKWCEYCMVSSICSLLILIALVI